MSSAVNLIVAFLSRRAYFRLRERFRYGPLVVQGRKPL